MAVSPYWWPRVCGHTVVQRCLFTAARWWYVCLACGVASDHQSVVEKPTWRKLW